MAQKKVIEKQDGVTESLIWDEAEGVGHFHRESDIEPIIEQNKQDLTSGRDGYTPSRDMKHVARVPVELLYHWEDQLGLKRGSLLKKEYWPKLRAMLNDPDNQFLRTSSGKI